MPQRWYFLYRRWNWEPLTVRDAAPSGQDEDGAGRRVARRPRRQADRRDGVGEADAPRQSDDGDVVEQLERIVAGVDVVLVGAQPQLRRLSVVVDLVRAQDQVQLDGTAHRTREFYGQLISNKRASTDSWTQCAAVRTCRSSMSEPPQKKSRSMRMATCHGNSCRRRHLQCDFNFRPKKQTKTKQNKKQCELGVVAPPLSYGHNEARESAQHQQSTTSPLTHGHSEPNLLLIAIRGGQLTLGSVSTPPTMRLVTSVTLVRRAIPQPSAADRTFV